MAATRKSAKRGAAKKASKAAKRPSAKKKAAKKRSSKSSSRKATRPSATRLKRQARKGLKAARGGLSTVLKAGGKTWNTLKSTTAQVVEGVKDTLSP